MSKKVCIKGDGTHELGKQIVEYLKGLGGINKHSLCGQLKVYYFIDSLNAIICKEVFPLDYELITLPYPTPEKTFPREMWVWENDKEMAMILNVIGIFENRYIISICDRWYIRKHAEEIEPFKTLTTDQKIADLQRQIDELKNRMNK